MGDLKDSAGDFAKRNLEKISRKTSEWISDIGDGLKLQIVDRWKMAIAERSTNKFIAHKERDIARESRKMVAVDGKIAKEEANKQKAEGEFAGLVEGVTNPALLAIIEKSKTEKTGKNDERLSELSAKKEERAKKQEAYNSDIEKYKRSMEELESGFAVKVDGRIEKIKTRDNYEDNKVRLETVEGSISRLTERISKTEKELIQYEKVWEQRKILGKEGKRELREKMDQLKGFLNNSEKHLERAEELKAKYEKQIAKTDKRIASLQEFKGKYVKGGNVDAEEDIGRKESVAETHETSTSSDIFDANNETGEFEKPEDVEKTKKIEACRTFNELYVALGEIGNIEGSKKEYTPADLIVLIGKVRRGERSLDYITGAFGLKENVERLLHDEDGIEIGDTESGVGPEEEFDDQGGEVVGKDMEDDKKAELVKACTTLDQLYRVLDEIGEVKGSAKKYSADELKRTIERYRNKRLGDIRILTNVFGIRVKAIELLKNK